VPFHSKSSKSLPLVITTFLEGGGKLLTDARSQKGGAWCGIFGVKAVAIHVRYLKPVGSVL
jgi:hypothetical protein